MIDDRLEETTATTFPVDQSLQGIKRIAYHPDRKLLLMSSISSGTLTLFRYDSTVSEWKKQGQVEYGIGLASSAVFNKEGTRFFVGVGRTLIGYSLDPETGSFQEEFSDPIGSSLQFVTGLSLHPDACHLSVFVNSYSPTRSTRLVHYRLNETCQIAPTPTQSSEEAATQSFSFLPPLTAVLMSDATTMYCMPGSGTLQGRRGTANGNCCPSSLCYYHQIWISRHYYHFRDCSLCSGSVDYRGLLCLLLDGY